MSKTKQKKLKCQLTRSNITFNFKFWNSSHLSEKLNHSIGVVFDKSNEITKGEKSKEVFYWSSVIRRSSLCLNFFLILNWQ